MKIDVLVAIANYGTKNIEYIKRLIQEYQSMPCNIDIVVLSNISKEFGPNVEVIEGLPTKDPWSLPFGHKNIFAERLEDYDLFIYSEDDILITWRNIEAFVELSKVLPEGNISGFMRYETDPAGKMWFPDFLGPYHWLPKSVNKLGQITVAEFSNVHSACYVLTRDQLRRAINSGGYLVKTHKGRYDLLCSAATDPYTQCGFRKVICISHISDILVHHLPNKYVGVWGIDEDDFDRQIAFMLSPEFSDSARQELLITTKNIDNIKQDKMYYCRPDSNLLSLVSQKTRTILFVGCAYPSAEAALVQNNHAVTAIPLDPIIGTLAASRGIKVMEADFEKAFRELDGTLFDCIIFSEVLQHLEDPAEILSRAVKLLAPNGEILVSVPNFKYLKFLKDHFPYPLLKTWTYSKHYLHMVSESHLRKWFRSIGLKNIYFQYIDKSPHLKKSRPFIRMRNILFSSSLLVRGKQTFSDHSHRRWKPVS